MNINEKNNENNYTNNAPIKRFSNKLPIDQNDFINSNNNDNYGDIPKYDNQRKLAKMNKEPQGHYFNNNRANNQTPNQVGRINSNYNSKNQINQTSYSNPNVVNSIILLLRELKENDLLSIRDELDKKLNDY